MAYGYIYKITTSCSEKVYIGQTIRTIEKRWQEHLNARNDEKKKVYTYTLPWISMV